MKTNKSLIFSAFAAAIVFGCGSTANILSTPVENIDNTPIKVSELTKSEKQNWGHLDLVKDLGSFLELEVVLKENQSIEEGQIVAEKLMQDLKINPEDLIAKARIMELSREAETWQPDLIEFMKDDNFARYYMTATERLTKEVY